MTGSAVASLLAAAITLPYLPFEDLYLTGMCARKANVSRFVHPRLVAYGNFKNKKKL